jgi:SPP1 gp7 family putative phage head morphogenesis protein
MDEKLIKALVLCFDKSPEEAIKYLKSLGYKISWDWKEQLQAIKEHCFTIAKCSSADILEVFKSSLESALENGQTFNDFQKGIKLLLEQKGYSKREDGSVWRLDTIFRTNLQSAYQAGRYKEQMELSEDFPWLEYNAVMDNRTRPKHAEFDGTIRPTNDPIWQTAFCPNGYNCRCRTRSISAAEMKRRNLKVTPEKEAKKFKPDPGFDNPPGTFTPDMSKYSIDIKKVLEEALK